MKRILIIDDDPVICALLKSFLSLKKYDVECVNRLEDAIKAIIKRPFDVVLTDMKIPDMVGSEIIKRIYDTKPGIKLIAMSGDTSFEKLPPDLRANLPFLRKPFRLQEVERLILELNSQKGG